MFDLLLVAIWSINVDVEPVSLVDVSISYWSPKKLYTSSNLLE